MLLSPILIQNGDFWMMIFPIWSEISPLHCIPVEMTDVHVILKHKWEPFVISTEAKRNGEIFNANLELEISPLHFILVEMTDVYVILKHKWEPFVISTEAQRNGEISIEYKQSYWPLPLNTPKVGYFLTRLFTIRTNQSPTYEKITT